MVVFGDGKWDEENGMKKVQQQGVCKRCVEEVWVGIVQHLPSHGSVFQHLKTPCTGLDPCQVGKLRVHRHTQDL